MRPESAPRRMTTKELWAEFEQAANLLHPDLLIGESWRVRYKRHKRLMSLLAELKNRGTQTALSLLSDE